MDKKLNAAEALVKASETMNAAVNVLKENLSDATWAELNPDERLGLWDAMRAAEGYMDTLKDIVRKGFAEGNEVSCLYVAATNGRASLSKNWSGVFKTVQENWSDISEELLKTTLKCNITDLEKVCLPYVEKQIAAENLHDTVDGVEVPFEPSRLFRIKLAKYIKVTAATPSIKDKRNAK